MMWPLTSFAVRQPAMSCISARQRSTTVAATSMAAGLAAQASALVLEFLDGLQEPGSFRRRFRSTAAGDVAGQGGSFGIQCGGQGARKLDLAIQ